MLKEKIRHAYHVEAASKSVSRYTPDSPNEPASLHGNELGTQMEPSWFSLCDGNTGNKRKERAELLCSARFQDPILKIRLDRSTVSCVKLSSETSARLSSKPLCYTWISDVDVFTDTALVGTSLG